jgi:hypothetical protein
MGEVHEYQFDIITRDRATLRGVPVLAVNRSAALHELRQIHLGCMVQAVIEVESRNIPRFLLKRQP